MMDVLSLVCVAVVSIVVTLMCVGVYLVVVERWKRQERQEINQRLEEQVKREAVVWRCWRCSNFFESEEQPWPLCLCNGCLEQYQKVVA